MRRVNSFDDVNIALGDISRWKDLKSTKDNDLRGLKFKNAGAAEDDTDFVILGQINPIVVFKITTPVVGVNVTNRVTCEAQKGVRILRWRLTANLGPTVTTNIFDIRKVPVGETDITKAKSIFPDGNANKIIHPVGSIRTKGAKFTHTPYDLMFEEELVLDVLQIGTSSGRDIFICLTCQLI